MPVLNTSAPDPSSNPASAAAAPGVDVCGIGLNATDTIILLPRFPAHGEKIELHAAEVLPGGQVASGMEACARWGLRARYVGAVGDDPAAEMQRARLAECGVEAHWFAAPGCLSQLAYILVDERSGERTILWKRDARLEIQPEQVQPEWVTTANAVLLDGHDTRASAVAAAWARAAGIPVVLDVDNIYDGLADVLLNTDYIVGSADFPARLTGERDLRAALRQIHTLFGCCFAGATLGKYGVVGWDGKELLHVPGFAVNAVDTTGAGDIFHGALVCALVHPELKDLPLENKLEFSNAAASLNCTAPGARGGIRRLEETLNFMRTHAGERHRPDNLDEFLANGGAA